MDGSSFDQLARLAATGAARRELLRFGLTTVVAGVGAALALGHVPGATARRRKGGKRDEPKKKVCVCTSESCRTRKKPKSKVKKILKRNDCAYRGRCTGINPCAAAPAPVRVSAPFRIEASWSVDSDHDTFLFVPRESAASNPGPFIKYDCNPDSNCDDEYPFACVDEDETNAGDEITTVHKLLGGRYEYWLQLDTTSPAGEILVQLVKDGSVLHSWSNPANPSGNLEISWHVFDVDGNTGTVTSAGETVNDTLPDAAREDHEDVCP